LADSAWLRGLEIVAVAVVAQAIWRMARDLCPNRERATIPAGPIVGSAA
jgi:chromate transporter